MSDLADHRIATISVTQLASTYPRTVGRNARLGSHGNGPTANIAILTTDQGATGWGVVRQSSADEFQDLVGAQVSDLFDETTGVTEERFEALDFPLYDLAGVILGKPVYQLLGAQGSTSVPTYSGAIYFDDLDPEDAARGIPAVIANCQADYDLGYRAFKLKIGRGFKWMSAKDGLQRDIEVTRAVREAFPDCKILVDANNGYTVDNFLTYLEGVIDCDLFWIEEPFPENVDDDRTLREWLNQHAPSVLIADGEESSVMPQADFGVLLGLADAGVLDVLIPDIVTYGFTKWRAIMPELIAHGVAASPHTWGYPIKSLYTAQLAAGVGNVLTVEGIPGMANGVDASGYRLIDGAWQVPDAPGFGLTLPPDLAASHRDRGLA